MRKVKNKKYHGQGGTSPKSKNVNEPKNLKKMGKTSHNARQECSDGPCTKNKGYYVTRASGCSEERAILVCENKKQQQTVMTSKSAL